MNLLVAKAEIDSGRPTWPALKMYFQNVQVENLIGRLKKYHPDTIMARNEERDRYQKAVTALVGLCAKWQRVG